MEKNNHSSYSSRCRKLRQALANSPAVRAIHRISLHHQESSRPSNSSVPQHLKGHYSEGNGAIPVKFDYSAPTSMEHAQVGKVVTKVEPAPEPPRYVPRAAFKGEEKGKSKALDFEQQYEKKDMNYMFSEYIQRAREKLRTVSNIGKGQSKPAPVKADISGAKKKDTHKDQISDFINQTKKKIRTTSSMGFGKTGSLKRG